jgi:hypothetical protein
VAIIDCDTAAPARFDDGVMENPVITGMPDVYRLENVGEKIVLDCFFFAQENGKTE